MIADLSVDDIRILNDHFAVRRIRQSSRAEDLPLEIGLRIDVSDSVQKTVAPEKQATPTVPQSSHAAAVGSGVPNGIRPRCAALASFHR